jgi:hypothetical protein
MAKSLPILGMPSYEMLGYSLLRTDISQERIASITTVTIGEQGTLAVT